MSTKETPPAGCEWYASRCGWTLRTGNVIVEGTSDASYFERCSQLYQAHYGRQLLGVDLSIFAAGYGNDGGTYGVSEKFPTLFNLASLDLDPSGRRKFRTIALLDNDRMGQRALAGITQGHRQIREYESIFSLKRVMPHRAGSIQKLAERTRAANAAFSSLECNIEDLLSDSFCEHFARSNPEAVARPATRLGGACRRYWTEQGKRELRLSALRNATFEDLQPMIEVLRALRTYVGLPADGAG
jgi:hypothetical protein